MELVDYEILKGQISCCYRYIEGEDKPRYWVDSQNCMYYTYKNDEYDNKSGLILGKNWWIISPYKPTGTIITKENENLINWFIDDSSVPTDIDYQWDFDNCKPNYNKKLK